MSRIGKLPVNLPSGVTITVDDANVVSVKGPLGTLSQKIDSDIRVEVENNDIILSRPNDEKRLKVTSRPLQGSHCQYGRGRFERLQEGS